MTNIQIQDKIIHLSNDHISYVIGILEGGVPAHLYFGKRLKTFHPQAILRRNQLKESMAFTPQNCALTHTPQEYPSYGLGDMREGALIVRAADGTESCDLRFVSAEVKEGKYALEGLPATFGDAAKTLHVHLKDELLGLEVTLLYAIFEDCDVIARSAILKNAGKDTLTLQRAASLCLDLPDANYDMITLTGDWARERDVVRRPIVPGNQSVSTLRGASSAAASPFVALLRPNATEAMGEVIGAAFVYSGSFYAGVDVDTRGGSRLMIGLNDRQFAWTLEKDASFTLPEAVLTYSDAGLDGMSQQFHTLCSEHLVRGKFAHAPRPILLNNWEATYFNFNEEKLVKIAQKASEVGIELFVLDDGWFGKRNDDHSSLGDWKVNTEKLPGGLKSVSEKVHAMGMQFGLWFEPEMISPDSDLYRAHPDWAMHIEGRTPIEGRNQLILDMSRADVCEYVYHAVADILKENRIDYVKWDMNRNFSNVGSAKLPAERMQELPHRYILGVYSVLERLHQDFPDVLFESCASGGGRFDMGMLYYMPQTWTSDNTDAVSRCRIQYGTSMVFPSFSMGSHISAVPNHQTGRITPITTRANVAMSGCFGFELDLNLLTDEEIAQLKEIVQAVKANREILLYGKMHRLLSPFEGHDTAWLTTSKDLSKAVLVVIRDLALPNEDPLLVQLRGLDPEKVYQIQETGEVYGGDELMYSGLSIRMPGGDAASVRWTLQAIEA